MYSNVSNQFVNLVKGEYGKTPVPVDPEFRLKIAGIGFREIEIGLDGVAGVQQCFFIVVAGCFDSLVKLFVDVGRQCVCQRVKRIRELFGSVHGFQLFPDAVQLLVDFS